jgi:hypothetical protein
MDTDFSFRLGMVTPMCYVNLPLVEVDRTETRMIGLMTEYPVFSIERLQVHEYMITKWLSLTKDSHPHLRRRLKARLSRAQSALANLYLKRQEFTTARALLRRAARQNLRPSLVVKYVWSVVAGRSLRREIIRRENAHPPAPSAVGAKDQRMTDALLGPEPL